MITTDAYLECSLVSPLLVLHDVTVTYYKTDNQTETNKLQIITTTVTQILSASTHNQ